LILAFVVFNPRDLYYLGYKIIIIIINVFGGNFRGAGARQCATEKREDRKPGRRGMSLACPRLEHSNTVTINDSFR